MRSSFLVVLLAVSSTGCGQTGGESLNERVANLIAGGTKVPLRAEARPTIGREA